MADITPRQAEVADAAAALCVATARAHHPDDPEAFARCALAMAGDIVAIGPAADIVVSVESPSIGAAELEQRLASPGAKWSE